MENNKRKWNLGRHRAQSPQFDISIKYQNKLWALGLIISFIIGIGTSYILQVWIFPWLYDPHPNVNLTLDDNTDYFRVLVENQSDIQYKLKINTDTPIDDFHLWFLLPGAIENIKEFNSKTDCSYIKSEQGFTYKGTGNQLKGEKLKGQDQLSIQCQRMGADSHYYFYFDLNEENYTTIYMDSPNGTRFQFPAFFTGECSYYFKGVNDRIIKNNCNVNITLSNTTMNSFTKRGIRLFN